MFQKSTFAWTCLIVWLKKNVKDDSNLVSTTSGPAKVDLDVNSASSPTAASRRSSIPGTAPSDGPVTSLESWEPHNTPLGTFLVVYCSYSICLCCAMFSSAVSPRTSSNILIVFYYINLQILTLLQRRNIFKVKIESKDCCIRFELNITLSKAIFKSQIFFNF